MGQAKRTTKINFNFAERTQGGTNNSKRDYLALTKQLLNNARTFYIDFFLMEGWDFSEKFPGMPVVYRRSVIKDAVDRACSHLSNYKNWEESGQKKGKPGLPGSDNHPVLYKGTVKLEMEKFDQQDSFVSINIYNGRNWDWVNYPVNFSPWQEKRLTEAGWENKSPRLVLREKTAELHVIQEKTVRAKKVKESKKNPDLITVGIDLNVKNMAVVIIRKNGVIIKTVFIKDEGLDHHHWQPKKKAADAPCLPIRQVG